MSGLNQQLVRLDAAVARLLARVAPHRVKGAAVLLALLLACYLPGTMALHPVDRTEVLFAENSQEMLERDEPINPHFIGGEQQFRPIGTYWLQMASAWLAGEREVDDITTYRIPSLLSVMLAGLLIYLLLATPLGPAPAMVAAALFAVTPIVALEGNLAVADGVTLGGAALAQLALLRVYTAPDGAPTRLLALLFWAAQGVSILLNAFAVPILSLSTIAALYVFDRRLGWLKRLHVLWGAPLMIALGAPWLIVRADLDGGVPFKGMSFEDVLDALGGSQHMQWKAAPLTFTLALAVGFLPGAVLWVPAVRTLWQNRQEALMRFILSWLLGYLLYLELISSKPALYTVPVLFPAAAAAAVLAMTRGGAEGSGWHWPRGALVPPAWLVAVGVPALYAALSWLTHDQPEAIVIAGALLVTVLMVLATLAGRARLPLAWAALSVAAFAAFIAYTFGLFLPRLDKAWPSELIAQATRPLQSCAPGPIGIVGFREPSAIFVLGDETKLASASDVAAWSAEGVKRVALVEDRWSDEFAAELKKRGAPLPARVGCVEAFNVMRGCPLSFSIYLTGQPAAAPSCVVASRFACTRAVPTPSNAKDSRCR